MKESSQISERSRHAASTLHGGRLLVIAILALASAGWTWTAEQRDTTLKVKREKLARTVYPEMGAPFFVCEAERPSVANKSRCVAGTFARSDGVALIDISAMDEDVTSWCLVVGEDWDSCVWLPELAHLTVARHAASLRSDDEYLEAASKYREAAKRGRGLFRDIGSQHMRGGPLEEWYLDLASQCEQEFLRKARVKAQALYEEGKTRDAMATLETAISIASQNNRIRDENDFRKALAKLREDDAKQQREIAHVRSSCKLVGEANNLLPGAAAQRVWLCIYVDHYNEMAGMDLEALDVVVEDGSRVLRREQHIGPDPQSPVVKSPTAALVDVTGTEKPELLLDFVDGCEVQTLEVAGWGADAKLHTIWSLQAGGPGGCGSGDDGIDYWAQDWWPPSWGEPSTPTTELADGRFQWEGESMVWDEGSQSFVPSRAGLNRYREREIERARKLLRDGFPAVARTILPDDAPPELVREIAVSCERVFLKALSNAKPVNEMRQKASPAEARSLKAEMLKTGLNCAPDSQALKRRLKPLEAQIKVDQERGAREAAKRLRMKRIETFQKQSVGGVKFGMTRAEVRNICIKKNGRWDGSSSTLVGCKRGGVTFGAGFCGRHVCSLYITNSDPWRKEPGYQKVTQYYESRFGEGERSSPGGATLVRWKLDPQKGVKVTLARFGYKELMTVALYSKGER